VHSLNVELHKTPTRTARIRSGLKADNDRQFHPARQGDSNVVAFNFFWFKSALSGQCRVTLMPAILCAWCSLGGLGGGWAAQRLYRNCRRARPGAQGINGGVRGLSRH